MVTIFHALQETPPHPNLSCLLTLWFWSKCWEYRHDAWLVTGLAKVFASLGFWKHTYFFFWLFMRLKVIKCQPLKSLWGSSGPCQDISWPFLDKELLFGKEKSQNSDLDRKDSTRPQLEFSNSISSSSVLCLWEAGECWVWLSVCWSFPHTQTHNNGHKCAGGPWTFVGPDWGSLTYDCSY